LPIKTTHQKA